MTRRLTKAHTLSERLRNRKRNQERTIRDRKSEAALIALRDIKTRPVIPDWVLADRDYRLAQPETFEARYFGDPAPGRSALDRIRA